MNIQLGNLSTQQICDRLQITLTEQEVETLESIRSQAADVPTGRWHGFDMPFSIYCGDKETAIIVRDIYAPYGNQMNKQLRIGFRQKREAECNQ